MRKTTLVSLVTLLAASSQAFAQAGGSSMGDKGLYALGLGLMLGLGAMGATLGQSKVGAAAMDGLARNPQARGSLFAPLLISLALIESLFILTWLIAFIVSGKI